MQILPTIHALAVPYSVPTKTAHQHDCRMVFLPGSFANYIKGGHLPEIWLCHDETRKVPVKRLHLELSAILCQRKARSPTNYFAPSGAESYAK